MLGVLYYLAMRVVIWRDFFNEAGPAVEHLIAGNLHGFLAIGFDRHKRSNRPPVNISLEAL